MLNTNDVIEVTQAAQSLRERAEHVRLALSGPLSQQGRALVLAQVLLLKHQADAADELARAMDKFMALDIEVENFIRAPL